MKISEIATDPLRHVSLEMGDAIALFALGMLIGIIVNHVWNSPFTCWGFA